MKKVYRCFSLTLSLVLSLAASYAQTLRVSIVALEDVSYKVFTYDESFQEVEVSPQADGTYRYPEQFIIKVASEKVSYWEVNGVRVKDFFGGDNQYPYLSQSDISSALGTDPLQGDIAVTAHLEGIGKKYKVIFGLASGSHSEDGSITAEKSDGWSPSSIVSGDLVQEGTELLFRAFPSAGREIRFWRVNGEERKTSESKLLLKIMSDTQVEVSFASAEPVLSTPDIVMNCQATDPIALYVKTKETESIGIDWGDGVIQKYNLSPSAKEKIEGVPQGTIKIYSPDLELFQCYNDDIKTLNIVRGEWLKKVSCYSNTIKNLQVPDLPLLEVLEANDNALTEVSLGRLPLLQELNLSNNQLSKIALENLPNLISLSLLGNRLTEINCTPCPLLEDLSVGYNLMEKMEIKGCEKLFYIVAYKNRLSAESLKEIFSLLPHRDNSDGVIRVFSSRDDEVEEGNVLNEGDIAIANRKGWKVFDDKKEIVTSVQQVQSDFVRVYPIPARDFVTVELPKGVSMGTISLYNGAGICIAQKEATTERNILDVSFLEDGLYWMGVDGRLISFTIRK